MYNNYPPDNGIFNRPQPGDTTQRDDVVALRQEEYQQQPQQQPRLVAAAPSNEIPIRIVLDIVVRVSRIDG